MSYTARKKGWYPGLGFFWLKVAEGLEKIYILPCLPMKNNKIDQIFGLLGVQCGRGLAWAEAGSLSPLLWQVGAVMHVLQFFSRNECTFDKNTLTHRLTPCETSKTMPRRSQQANPCRTYVLLLLSAPQPPPRTLHAFFLFFFCFFFIKLQARIYENFVRSWCACPRLCECSCGGSMGVSMVA